MDIQNGAIRNPMNGAVQLSTQTPGTGRNQPCMLLWLAQTETTFIMDCNLYDNRDSILSEGTQGYQTLISDSKKSKVVTTWLMKTGLLPQFSLAMEQLQE